MNKNLTINTNGKTFYKQTNTITVNRGVTLSFIGTGTVEGGDACPVVTNNGTLNITNATINYSSYLGTSTRYAAIKNETTGTITINSGTVRSKYRAITNSGIVNVKDGIVEATGEGIGTFTEEYVNAIYAEQRK